MYSVGDGNLQFTEIVECSKWHSNATGKMENNWRLSIKKKKNYVVMEILILNQFF